MTAAVIIALSGSVQAQVPLLIFGGNDHKTFLGCLNCGEYGSDSVTNSSSPYGSAFSTESIWNHFGEYGSQFSGTGVCSQFANDPPVVVDRNGGFYGRLTLNRFASGAITADSVVKWLENVVCK